MTPTNKNPLEQMRRGAVTCNRETLPVLIASTYAEKHKGLSHITKDELGDRGMLFILGSLDSCFVMDDVLMPLEIAFLSSTGTVISTKSMPVGMRRSLAVPQGALYAIEANVGVLARFGLVRGVEATILMDAPLP